MVIVFSIANLCGKPGSPCSQFTGFIREMLRSYHETFLPRALEKPLITGDDLIDELGVNPSPAFKTVLRIIEEKRLNGSVSSRREAVDLARTLMAEG
jgi:hypothetical protein